MTEAGLRIAYLNTRYPAASHTFIEREVAALRRKLGDAGTLIQTVRGEGYRLAATP